MTKSQSLEASKEKPVHPKLDMGAECGPLIRNLSGMSVDERYAEVLKAYGVLREKKLTDSEFVEQFNHDQVADAYDEDVKDESIPTREAYAQVMSWIASKVLDYPSPQVLDLGSGTGNIADAIEATNSGQVSGYNFVDASQQMSKIALSKFEQDQRVNVHHSDLLGFFEDNSQSFDVIVSGYAIHHLTEPEKFLLFDEMAKALKPGGKIIIADLMFYDEGGMTAFEDKMNETGHGALLDITRREFFWDIPVAVKRLEELGFKVDLKQFSSVSWGMEITRQE